MIAEGDHITPPCQSEAILSKVGQHRTKSSSAFPAATSESWPAAAPINGSGRTSTSGLEAVRTNLPARDVVLVFVCLTWTIKGIMNGTRRRALITGSTSGIGLGIAEELAASGCDVVLSGFGEPAMIAALARRLEHEHQVRAIYLGADLADAGECRSLAERAQAALGTIDILINNAGIQHVAPVQHFPIERWDAVIAVNLSSAFHLTACLLPAMLATGYGRIINIASAHGLVGSKEKSAYVAAKHGLVGLTKVVALETAGRGVTCNAICPGWVLTPLVDAQIRDRMQLERLERRAAEAKLLEEKQPSGEFVTPSQIGALTVFLCSAAAAGITGASLPVDGGWTAR